MSIKWQRVSVDSVSLMYRTISFVRYIVKFEGETKLDYGVNAVHQSEMNVKYFHRFPLKQETSPFSKMACFSFFCAGV